MLAFHFTSPIIFSMVSHGVARLLLSNEYCAQKTAFLLHACSLYPVKMQLSRHFTGFFRYFTKSLLLHFKTSLLIIKKVIFTLFGYIYNIGKDFYENKITPSVILLIITVIFFIAGIFSMGIQARQQISDTEQSLDAFISQVKDKQQALNDAQTFFIRCQRKKDLLNYRQQKASGRQTAVQEHRDTQESSEAVTSVFSQDHS
ncbi:MAG: hypothetical protein ACLTJW_10980 [Blautia caecimuris]